MFFLGATWVITPFIIGRDKEAENRLVGALNVVQENIERSYAAGLAADVFDSPSIQPQAQPNVWSLSGTVAIQDSAGTTVHEKYVAVVENLCQNYGERRCWNLKKLTVGDEDFSDRIGMPLTAQKPESTSPSGFADRPFAARKKQFTRALPELREAPSSTVAQPSDPKGSRTKSSERSGEAPSAITAEPTEVPTAGSEEIPRTAPLSDTYDSAGGTTEATPSSSALVMQEGTISRSEKRPVDDEDEKGLVSRIQSRLKNVGLDPGPLDGLMGPRTRNAIETYQRRNSLVVDGRPTRALLDRLRRESKSQKVGGIASARRSTRETLTATASVPKGTLGKSKGAEDLGITSEPANTGVGPRKIEPGFSVELSGLESIDEIKERRKYLEETFPNLLNGTDLVIERVDLGERGNFYRIVSKPFPDRLTANYVCARVRVKKQYCQLTRPESKEQLIATARISRAALTTEETESRDSIRRSDALSYARAGVEAHNNGDPEEAIDFYSIAIESGSLTEEDLARVYNNRGAAFKSAGSYELAIDDYTEAIRLSNGYGRAYYNRGLAYDSKGLLNRAIEDYSIAIKLEPDNARAHNNRGLAYDKVGDYDEAIADFSDAVRLAPGLDYAYFNRGRSYQKSGDRRRAMEDFRKAYSLNPDNGDYQAKMREFGLLQ